MPFRSDAASGPALFAPPDPLERFQAIYAALVAQGSWLSDKVALRLASASLITLTGEPALLASATHRRDAELRVRLGWLTSVAPSLRVLLAAQMVKYADDSEAFADEVERVREMFRAIHLRNGHAYEALAVLVLRRLQRGQPIEQAQVLRLRDIYEAMKRHHWFLTGPEDFPVCAMLVGRPGTPAEIGAGTDALYRALHDRADLWRGDSLQTAANMLYLTGVEPPVLVERFATILAGFREAGTRIGQEQYDELAILCFLARPTATIVTTVTAYRDRLRPAIPWLTRTDALNLAASLAFIEIAGQDPDALGPLADVKLLLDMQAIVAARAAATA
ncbi:MAG: DUF4003 family protein [Myxococcales bacterium]|nr:DUF4003 family protein [Myxococcales bacterium]